MQTVQQRHWALALLIGGVALAAVVCPLADAAISRRGELAADRQAAAAGLGPQLAAALQALGGRTVRRPGWPGRLLAHHPAVGRRVQLSRPPQR